MKIVLLEISLCAGLAMSVSARATNLVTGNGFGFAVVSPQTATISKFYAHPYSFAKPDPQNELREGIATTNFIKSLAWNDPDAHPMKTEYEEESQVIHARSERGEGYFFMPFGLRRAALIVQWKPAIEAGTFHVEWNSPVTADRHVRVGGVDVEMLQFSHVDERLLLIPLGEHQGVADDGRLLAGRQAWAMISLADEDDSALAVQEFGQWRAGKDPEALVKREIAELEHWRAKAPEQWKDENARRLWRQSEVMLRIAQCREPNSLDWHGNGLIVASLPDGVWFTPWVRDMAWATVALTRMGHREEARAAVLAYFNAQPTGKMRAQTAGADYQVSVVRYFGNGAEEPFFTMEGSTNIEFDDWGEVLWVLGEYLRKYNDTKLLDAQTFRGPVYQSARDYIVKPLLANLEPYGTGLIVAADTSIWEERQKDKKHFAFSTAMAIVGLREFAEVAGRMQDHRAQSDTLNHLVLLRKGFEAAFIRDGRFRGTLEEGVKNDIDGALLAIIHFGVVTNPDVVRDTLKRMQLLKVDSGGYRRVRSTYTDPAIFEYWYERQEFLFVDFSLAEVNRSVGRDLDAAGIVARVVDKAAADHFIIPEMYVALDCTLFPGMIGDPTGARPMVGYGAGAYILDVLDEARSRHDR